MAIWHDRKLIEWIQNGGLEFYPPTDEYDLIKQVNSSSVDLRLGRVFRAPLPIWTELAMEAKVEYLQYLIAHDLADPRKHPESYWTEERELPEDGLILLPGQFILACSMEKIIVPDNAAAVLYSKSTTGRMGLEHLHAGFGDPGFEGVWTWEFHNDAPWPQLLKPGMKVMQVVICDTSDVPSLLYGERGHYQGQVGATPPRG